jgi:hypothetical protein
MVKRKNRNRKIFGLPIPACIIGVVAASCIYTLIFFIAYDLGEKTAELKYLGIKAQEDKRETGDPIAVPLFVPPEKVHRETRFNFTYDNEEILRPLREREKLDQVIAGARTDMEVFLRLMKWVRAQWSPGKPDPYPPINAIIILDKIRKKETGGFCAQYCYVLVQCLQSFGYKARYVTIKNHEVTEVWSPAFAKWIMLDPLNELYISKGGTPLSVFEIHTMILRGEHDLEVHAQKYTGDLHQYLSRYEKFAVWLKNNHVSSPINFADIERYKVYFLDDPRDRMYVPMQSLCTLFPGGLYSNPFKRYNR